VFAIGPEWDLTYPVEWLGDDLALLESCPRRADARLKAASVPRSSSAAAALAKGRAWRALAEAGEKFKPGPRWLERLQRAAHRGGAHGRADAGLRA
jgi:hypothetical protein